MKLFILAFALLVGLFASQAQANSKMVCYYDSSSFTREGLGKLLNPDLEIALQFCSYLVYGYAGINPNNYQIFSLNEGLDIGKHQFSEITALKKKHSHLKVLLSVGGDKDNDANHPNKYIELLESDKAKQAIFINSAHTLLRSYGFDGLDLAFQFPKNKARKVHSDVGMVWKKFKKIFTGDFIVDPQADMHKEQFTAFVRDLHNSLRQDNLLLSLTVLPNVNSTWYYDVPAISGQVDWVNLAAFDFLTPDRNPEEADYTAPIYPLNEQNRLPHYNIDYQVDYWLSHQCPSQKIFIGVASYGRAWKLSTDSGTSGVPVVSKTEGAAAPGMQSQIPGLLSWPEICSKLPNAGNLYLHGADAPLRLEKHPENTRRHGNYAFRAADANGEHGIWVSYEDPETASNKASYANAMNLGGVSLFDLSYDDFRGLCSGDKYPILRAIKYKL
ncbi:chitinase-like protein Idgf2 [Teleopsis dalmanni]|uniref:chitinase-like protein Idgf2 n=1 Tax=Teleopsis dalmanni TaxID=139649 RepID=UPI0018CFA3F3|nr:chitinase-like protein Idgf2 [Teleopsis dalmanni]